MSHPQYGSVDGGTKISLKAIGVALLSGEEAQGPVSQQQDGARDKSALYLSVVDDKGCEYIGQCDTLQYPQDADPGGNGAVMDRVCPELACQMAMGPFYKGEPVEEQTDGKYQDASGEDFFQEDGVACLFQAGHNEGERIADCKKEKREYQIRRGATMPGGMLQWGINIAPAAGIVDKYHQSYRRSAENIEGIEALFQQQPICRGS